MSIEKIAWMKTPSVTDDDDDDDDGDDDDDD